MRLFITGIKGQLGQALVKHGSSRFEISGGDLPEVDITERASISSALTSARPDLVIHCAALTDVDGCARDPVLAYRVNGMGTQQVALACQQVGAALVHISTNEVFSGRLERRRTDGGGLGGYREFDPPDPINPYGESKAYAEWFVRSLLTRFYIVRTAWLYAPGGRNFVHSIRRAADELGALRVVTDEIANPTSSDDLAQAILQLIDTGCYGIYHLVNEGACSRYAFAAELLALTGRGHVPLTPIVMAQWPRPSTPPAFAPLENVCAAALGICLRPWQDALADHVARYG